MKKLLKNIICRSVNHARSTVHGRPSQQMRLGKKKKKKENTERKNMDAQTCNPNTYSM